MRIAQVGPIYWPVPPPRHGGIELMLSWLTEELVRRGHEVTLFATGESKTSATLDATEPVRFVMHPNQGTDGRDREAISEHYQRRTEAHIARALARAGEFDVVHGHFGRHDFAAFTAGVATPTLMTYHMPIDRALHLRHLETTPCHFVALSRSHRGTLPGISGLVPHGIRVADVPFSASSGDGLVLVGRMVAEKGVHHAITVAKETGLPLTLVGKSYVKKQDKARYFQERIQPHVDDRQIRYTDALPNTEARALMGQARAFLMPIEWEEPFGLVMIESLATGTPVIAFRRGAAPEIVEDGVTGFVVDTVEEMVAAVRKIDRIDRAACRRAAEERFSVGHMVDAYERIYQEIIAAGPRRYASEDR